MPSDLVDKLTGQDTGNHCDACARSIGNGDTVFAYLTYAGSGPWVCRRTWCESCANPTINSPMSNIQEAILSAVMWRNQLAAVEVCDLNLTD